MSEREAMRPAATIEPEPEYCWKCRDVCPVYFANEPEGTAIVCQLCGACLDYVYRED